MSRRRQTRRSVSVKGTTYARIKLYTEKHGGSISGFVEDVIARRLGEPTAEDRRKFDESVAARQASSEAEKAQDDHDDHDDLDDYVPPNLLL